MAIQNLTTLSTLAFALYLSSEGKQHHECNVEALATEQDQVWDEMKSAALRYL